MKQQSSNHILMIKPDGFAFNIETAKNNHFQSSDDKFSKDIIVLNAITEFNSLVNILRENHVDVVVIDDLDTIATPDAVFPNNWFSTHTDGKVFLYPMFAKNRRKERKKEIFEMLTEKNSFKINEIIDLSKHEESDLFLEGTGSMILDRQNKIIYASISERTSLKLLNIYSESINYDLVSFKSFHKVKNENVLIYHTNVMMCIASTFCIICLESILDNNQKNTVVNSLIKSNKTIIEIDLNQINHFSGNMLEVQNNNSDPFLVMSSTAFYSLSSSQISQIEMHCEIIHSPLPTIEKYGGGSARCMMAEIFLPKII
jgi:hypothetical protein